MAAPEVMQTAPTSGNVVAVGPKATILKVSRDGGWTGELEGRGNVTIIRHPCDSNPWGRVT